jgi:hypothetical protein
MRPLGLRGREAANTIAPFPKKVAQASACGLRQEQELN